MSADFPFRQVAQAFYPPPTVGGGGVPDLISIDPDNTTTNNLEPFTLTGTGFLGHGAASVVFHRAGPVNFAATGEVVVDNTTITGTTAAMSNGVYDVILTFADGSTDTLPAAFTVNSP